jgi:hypothetical protein
VARTTLQSDQATTSTSFGNITGLSFPVYASRTTRFRAVIDYTVNATTIGTAFSLTGPASPTRLQYKVTKSLTATSDSVTYVSNTDYTTGADAVNATSASTTGNLAIVEGTITPAADGTVTLQHLVESTGTLTAKAGSSVEYDLVK